MSAKDANPLYFLKDNPSPQALAHYKLKYPNLDPDAIVEALELIRRGNQLLQRLESYVAEHGLNVREYQILVAIDQQQDRDSLEITELADQLDAPKHVVKRSLKRLYAEGFVEYETVEEDRRRRLVRLTDAAAERLHAIRPGLIDRVNRFMNAKPR